MNRNAPKLVTAVSLLVLAVAGCRASTYERTEVTEGYRVAFSATEAAYISVWTDPETGCESYVTDDGFMSPRLTADGSQRCPQPVTPALQEQVIQP